MEEPRDLASRDPDIKWDVLSRFIGTSMTTGHLKNNPKIDFTVLRSKRCVFLDVRAGMC